METAADTGGTFMEERQQFDYYYGLEADQFAFYRVPKILVKDERFSSISSDAKILYGLMLDRMSLSVQNQWLDDQSRVYIIYTLEEIQEDFNCGKNKGSKIFSELEACGLIERRRQGQGKPAIIYVKNFVRSVENKDIFEHFDAPDGQDSLKQGIKTPENKKSRLPKTGNQDSRKQGIKIPENRESRLPETGNQDSRKQGVIKTDINKTDINNIYNPSIYPIVDIMQSSEDGSMDFSIQTANVYADIIRSNIAYDILRNRPHVNTELLDEIYALICSVVSMPQKKPIRINGVEYPYQLVQAKFLKLRATHIEYVMETMKKTNSDIKNIRGYLLTVLWNSVDTINFYYQQRVQHDMNL